MGRNFDDYPGFQPFRAWANIYAQDCTIKTYLQYKKCLYIIKYMEYVSITAGFCAICHCQPGGPCLNGSFALNPLKEIEKQLGRHTDMYLIIVDITPR